MPDMFKHSDGQTNWAAIFSALAASMVLIIQQYQSYQIAVIDASTKHDEIILLNKKEFTTRLNKVEKSQKEILDKLSALHNAERKQYKKLNEIEEKRSFLIHRLGK